MRLKHFHRFLSQILLMLLGLTLAIPIIGVADNPGKVVRIGYQKSGAFLLMKNEGSLEKSLAPLGYRVEWKEFPSGPPLLEALNAGSLDVGHSGDAPLIFAQAAGIAEAVMLKSELRKPRYGAEPMSSVSIGEQQQVADTFFQLGLVPKAIRTGDAVFQTKQ